MRIFPIILILLGVLIIANPDIIAYIIGYIFLISGIFGVLGTLMRKKSETNDTVWNMGGYEIIKRKK